MQRSNKLRRSSVRLILIRTSNPIYRDIYIYISTVWSPRDFLEEEFYPGKEECIDREDS